MCEQVQNQHMGVCVVCVRTWAYAHTHTHTEEFSTPFVIFNQEYDPSSHLGFLTWWPAACTKQRLWTHTHTHANTRTHARTHTHTHTHTHTQTWIDNLRPPTVCWEFGLSHHKEQMVLLVYSTGVATVAATHTHTHTPKSWLNSTKAIHLAWSGREWNSLCIYFCIIF